MTACTTQPTLRQRALAAHIAQREAEAEAERQREVDRYTRHVGLLTGHLRTQLGIHITEDEGLDIEQPGHKDAPAYIEDDLLFVVDTANRRVGPRLLRAVSWLPDADVHASGERWTGRHRAGIGGVRRDVRAVQIGGCGVKRVATRRRTGEHVRAAAERPFAAHTLAGSALRRRCADSGLERREPARSAADALGVRREGATPADARASARDRRSRRGSAYRALAAGAYRRLIRRDLGRRGGGPAGAAVNQRIDWRSLDYRRGFDDAYHQREYVPPSPMTDRDYSRGWLDGCIQFDRDNAPEQFGCEDKG